MEEIFPDPYSTIFFLIHQTFSFRKEKTNEIILIIRIFKDVVKNFIFTLSYFSPSYRLSNLLYNHYNILKLTERISQEISRSSDCNRNYCIDHSFLIERFPRFQRKRIISTALIAVIKTLVFFFLFLFVEILGDRVFACKGNDKPSPSCCSRR